MLCFGSSKDIPESKPDMVVYLAHDNRIHGVWQVLTLCERITMRILTRRTDRNCAATSVLERTNISNELTIRHDEHEHVLLDIPWTRIEAQFKSPP